MEVKVDFNNVLDVIGTASASYVALVLTGGPEIPGFRELVPWVAALATAIAVWRLVRKDNNAKPAAK